MPTPESPLPVAPTPLTVPLPAPAAVTPAAPVVVKTATPIFEGSALVVKVTPPDYSVLPAGQDRSGLKADVTLRTDALAADWHCPIDRSRIAEFEQLAYEGKSVTITVG